MKFNLLHTTAILIALAMPISAWAQQQDLEVTIGVVPADASPNAATAEIKLPEPRTESSVYGLGIAKKAQELGRDFGKEVSTAAQQRGQARNEGTRPAQP
jgi:hypothetical protein